MCTVAKHRLTEQEYLERERAAEAKSEFVDGEIFAMSGGSSRHAQICGNVIAALHHALDARPCRVYTSDLKVRTPFAGSIHYPDVSALCGPSDFADGADDVLLNPSLIVEVLSPSTEDYDRGRKFLFYRSVPSLVDYVLAASDERRVEHYRRQNEGTWLLTSIERDEDTLALGGIGVTLRIADIYAGIEFPPSGMA